MTEINTKIAVNVETMQFGETYIIGSNVHLADYDGVHISFATESGTVLNVRLHPEQALDLARKVSEAAHKAFAHRLRGEGRPVTKDALENFGKDS